MMKRLLLWSSPKSLLQAIMQFTLLCLFVAVLIMKSFTLDSNTSAVKVPNSQSNSMHRTLQFSQENTQEPDDALIVDDALILDHNTSMLRPKVTDWDQQRQAWLANSTRTHPRRKPRILLVTGSSPHECKNAHGDHSLLKFIKNKIDYCRLHDIEIFYNMAHLDTEMTDCWSKLPLLRKLMLAHPEIEWLWWMDSDAMFTDMAFELPMKRYEQYNMVIHGFKELVYKRRSWVGLNAGVFLIRNCQWTLDLMEEWAPMGASSEVRERLGKFFTSYLTSRPYFEGDDQAGLVYLLNTQKERWGKKVHLEEAYYLHGYWEMLVDKYEEMMEKWHPGLGDERWPFVTHFVGCKPCGVAGVETKERCFLQMERAFNFADNQVLQRYGFHHDHLGTPTVTPM